MVRSPSSDPGQACGAAVFSCGRPSPATQRASPASGACTKALAALPKLASDFATTITKACGASPLTAGDVLAANGIDADADAATCKALGVASLTSLGDVTTCLQRQLECRADQMSASSTPRLAELLNAAGAALP